MLATSTAIAGAAFRSQGQKDVKGQEQSTVIQEGQMTERQKQHSKLFKHSGPKLRDLAARQTGDIEVAVGLGLIMRVPDSAPRPPVFQSAVCHADAVVIGTIDSKSAQLTEDENFVFTDYQTTVEEVIKNNVAAPIAVASTITTTRDGGVVELNNRTFRAKREDFDPPIVGQRYLLFLRFIPATGSYLMYGNGTFRVEAQRIIALGPGAREVLLNDGSKDASSFIGEIRAFATSDCQR